jgi:hypothetical protein
MWYSEPQDPDPNFLEMLNPDPAPLIMNTDPQPWWQAQKTCPRDRYLSYCSLQTRSESVVSIALKSRTLRSVHDDPVEQIDIRLKVIF